MVLTERFSDALNLALFLHRKQYRKGTEIPYFSHLIAVASLVMENGGSEDEVIAALLHDSAEDQGGEAILSLLKEGFGENVASIIRECSDAIVEDKDIKPPWEERKTAYINHIRTKSDSARLISLADKVHNGRAILNDYRQIGEVLWERFNPKREQTIWYYRSLVKAFQESSTSPLVDELDRAVTELEGLTGITEYR